MKLEHEELPELERRIKDCEAMGEREKGAWARGRSNNMTLRKG